MTNTRITDVEILEKRYPVLVDQFTFRLVTLTVVKTKLNKKGRTVAVKDFIAVATASFVSLLFAKNSSYLY